MESRRERLKNLLAVLLEALVADPEEAWLDRSRFLHLAALDGYDDEEIRGLLDWLQSTWLPRPDDRRAAEWEPGFSAGEGVRCFGADEQEFLTPPAFGHLLDLCRAGQISRQQMEAVIHFASQVSLEPLGRQDIDLLLDQVFFSFGEQESPGFGAEGQGNVH